MTWVGVALSAVALAGTIAQGVITWLRERDKLLYDVKLATLETELQSAKEGQVKCEERHDEVNKKLDECHDMHETTNAKLQIADAKQSIADIRISALEAAQPKPTETTKGS